jgi:hypothetical protein
MPSNGCLSKKKLSRREICLPFRLFIIMPGTAASLRGRARLLHIRQSQSRSARFATIDPSLRNPGLPDPDQGRPRAQTQWLRRLRAAMRCPGEWVANHGRLLPPRNIAAFPSCCRRLTPPAGWQKVPRHHHGRSRHDGRSTARLSRTIGRGHPKSMCRSPGQFWYRRGNNA